MTVLKYEPEEANVFCMCVLVTFFPTYTNFVHQLSTRK
ncbi:hypothetical protein AHF37_02784 [Paragonimus kellicotti]|nr:hypothetical protein AHF37_02784 [Paragonimus kellicotti]